MVPFRTFRGPLFLKPVTVGLKLFLAVLTANRLEYTATKINDVEIFGFFQFFYSAFGLGMNTVDAIFTPEGSNGL